MSADPAWHAIPSRFRRQCKRAQCSDLCAIALAAAAVLAAGPAVAGYHSYSRLEAKESRPQRADAEPFGRIPKGPLQIIISVDQQKLHLYSDGVHVMDTLVATGVPEHPTPLGVFDIIQKSRLHLSNIYSNAPMPYMQRITWSGVALHEGVGVGHRASHGCIRMPHEFATRLWGLTRLGARVIIADPELHPAEFADPHLFVHKEPPAETAPVASAPAKPLVTAQSVDAGKTTDEGRDGSKDAADPQPRTAADPPAIAADKAALPMERKSSAATAVAPADPPEVASATTTPIDLLRKPSKTPIAIFISRKTKKIYVRQDFAPLFSAPIIIENPDQRLGTHIFTALDYLDDGSTLRWNVVSLPGQQTPAARHTAYERRYDEFAGARRQRDERSVKAALVPPPQPPQQALAGIEIPQDVIDQISQLIMPGSSLIISDQGLGDETGEGTDFVVIAR